MTFSASVQPIVKNPPLRLAAALMLLYGAFGASTLPYVSALGINDFGVTHDVFSVTLLLAAVVSVTSSIAFGIYADRTARRRGIAIAGTAFLGLGTGLMTFAPSAPAFVLTHGLILPLSNVLFGHLFAFARLAVSELPEPDERLAVQTVLRAFYALPWVVILPVWALVIAQGAPLWTIYPVCFAIALLMLGLTCLWWPRDGRTRWVDLPSGIGIRQSLAEIGSIAVVVRVMALGGISSAATLYLVLLGLVFAETPGRGDSATALYSGTVAGLEVFFMLGLTQIVGRVSQVKLIFIGTVLYCVHLVGLPFLAPVWLVWLLPLAAAAGGAIIFTIPMAYMQDLLGDRPGAGASLFALMKLFGEGTSAAVFAICTGIAGYGFAAVTGATIAIGAALFLVAMDRRRI